MRDLKPKNQKTSRERNIVLMIHNVRSLHNVGSMFRTADAAGVARIYLTGYTPRPTDRLGSYRAEIEKTALGAERSVPWESVSSLSSVIAKLKKGGFFVCALEQHSRSMPYHHFVARPHKKDIALIVGNEVRGLSSAALQRVDTVLELPMVGQKESLNVSVAAGIALFRLRYP